MAPKCKVCSDSFAPGNKEPLSLKCGHSFCRECLNKIKATTGSLKCPTCRVINDTSDVSKLTVNYDLMTASVSSCSTTIPGGNFTPMGSAPPSKGAISVVVKDLTDQQFRLPIQPTSTIKDLKKVLQAQYGIAPENTRLLFRGRRLEDNKTLNDYCITTGNIIQMSTRYVGGDVCRRR
ncbi:Polyubiquitin-like [Homarus americanus]|uniref:Polyubiquitin-like n=2 Tax=Homarus americanus TaxID=6706 RepID=A0A8J5JN92_HOMAM|nr:Polyubiquitin-like [Homarus americanus]